MQILFATTHLYVTSNEIVIYRIETMCNESEITWLRNIEIENGRFNTETHVIVGSRA